MTIQLCGRRFELAMRWQSWRRLPTTLAGRMRAIRRMGAKTFARQLGSTAANEKAQAADAE